MDKYKATKNNVQNENDLEETLQKSQKEKNDENNAKNIQALAEVASNTPHPYVKAAGMAVKGVDKLTGGKASETLGKALTKANEISPIGNQVQNLSNNLSESGVSDSVKNISSLKNGNVGSAMGNNNKSNSSNTTNDSTSNDSSNTKKSGGIGNMQTGSSNGGLKGVFQNMPPALKIKIILLLSVVFLFFIIFVGVFAQDDIKNLSLTNNTNMTSKSPNPYVLSALEEVANWYITNVPRYDQSLYIDSPFEVKSVRADCSGFVVAYMSHVSGKALENVGTGVMIDKDGSWANEAIQSGWKVYTSEEIGGAANLQPGDVLVEHIGGTNGHTEVYVSPTETFGWGSKQTQYPLSKTIVDTNNNMFGDGRHSQYSIVYRYANAIIDGENTNISNDLQITKMNDESFNHGPKSKTNQKYIMLHDTEMDADAATVVNSWKNSGNGVAAHFVVNKDGTIVQAVDMDTITHHAGWGGPGDFDSQFGVGNNDGNGSGDDLVGVSKEGYENYTSYGMNSYSIGIEICHVNGESYPEAQLEAIDKLIQYIDSYYGTKSTIIDHKMWRPSNSDTDTNFPLQNYINNRHH